MSCKHETFIKPIFPRLTVGNKTYAVSRKVCSECFKTSAEIDLEAKLEAANEELTAQDMLIQEAKKGAEIMGQQLAAAETALAEKKERLKMYKDELYLPQGELSLKEISEFLHTLPMGSIWYFIASKWDAVTARYKTLRQVHEDAAGMGLEDSFFAVNGITPDELCDEEVEKLRQRVEQAESNFNMQIGATNREITARKQAEASCAAMRNCQNCYHNIRDKNVCRGCEKGLTKWVMEPLLRDDPPSTTERGAPFDEQGCYNPDVRP
ncbi:MAG: hypothetical protein AB9917_02130 [Negativicutes bacterium]